MWAIDECDKYSLHWNVLSTIGNVKCMGSHKVLLTQSIYLYTFQSNVSIVKCIRNCIYLVIIIIIMLLFFFVVVFVSHLFIYFFNLIWLTRWQYAKCIPNVVAKCLVVKHLPCSIVNKTIHVCRRIHIREISV